MLLRPVLRSLVLFLTIASAIASRWRRARRDDGANTAQAEEDVMSSNNSSSDGGDAGFAGTTFGVASEMFEMLRSSLGHEYDILVLTLGSALLYAVAKAAQRRLEDLFFVQILLGGPTSADEELIGSGGGAADSHEAMMQGLDPDELDGAQSRSSYYAMLQRQAESKRLGEDVQGYAARRAMESTNPLRWLFPLPTLRVTSKIDASTLWDDDAEGTREVCRASPRKRRVRRAAPTLPRSHLPPTHPHMCARARSSTRPRTECR